MVISRNGHLPDWSSPDDPARFLAAVGRLKPSLVKSPSSSETQLGLWAFLCAHGSPLQRQVIG